MSNTKNKSVQPPTKFVGLHAHTNGSIGDAIGLPKDHIDFALKNGMDALAVTDHGNMNSYSHQYLYWKKLLDQGVNFKAIPGIEAYFIKSHHEWSTLYENNKRKKELIKEAKKQGVTLEELSDQYADIKEELDELTQGGTVVENEEESKQKSWRDPLKKRSHLVLLPKNQQGLYDLFKMVSLSYQDGFYRFPRIDLEMIEKFSKGNFVASSACLGGYLSSIIFEHQTDPEWENWSPNDENFETIQKELASAIQEFQGALGGKNPEENFYLELQFNKIPAQHLVNYHLMEASKRTGAPLLVTCDSHYSDPAHWREREIYKAMAWMNIQKDSFDKDSIPKHVDELKCELYPKNAEQVWESYKETTNDKGWEFYDDQVVKDAIEKSYEVAHDQIDIIHPDRSVKLPALHRIIGYGKLEKTFADVRDKNDGEEPTEDDVAFEALKKEAIQGLIAKKLHEKQDYVDRLKEELLVVKHLKFSRYFLTYSKLMNLIAEKQLTGFARGSAAGSLLSYVCGITQVDPIKYGLLFERFLVRHKKGFPDIDSDVSDRTEALNIVTEFFKQENVIPVSNFNQLQMRSLIKDICRMEGITFEEANSYTKKIEGEARNEAKKTPGFDAAQWVLTYEEAFDKSPTFRKLLEKYPSFENTLKVLFKEFRSVSRHAGGVIITEDAFRNMPVIKSGGVLQTPWQEGLNFRHLESFGLLKFDILGLGTLRMFENCIHRILKKDHKVVTFPMIKEWFYQNCHPDNNDLDDIQVYKNVYWNKNYAGVFQFVQPPVQNFARLMKPRSINDIAVATSIFRPGPLSLNVDKKYLKNRKNPKSIKYVHPLLEECLGDTCGLLIFQEQLQLIYHKLAGVPLDETDAVRKAFTKKDISNKEKAEKEREALKQDFIEKCQSANGIDPKLSSDLFEEIEALVAYSFNKSHATSYAIASYICAWFLTYYPDEWICTYIDYCTTEKGKAAGGEDPKAVALSEALQLGYSIGRPDINLSEREFTIKDKVLIPSFDSLKHCGKSATREIFQNRPYESIEDLLFDPHQDTWRHSKFNKRTLSTLIKTGAFESMDLVGSEEHHLFENYRQMHEALVEHYDEMKRACARKKSRDHKDLLKQYIEEAQELPAWSLKERIEFSKQLTGSVDISLIITPDIRAFLKSRDIVSIDDWSGKHKYYWAVCQNSKVAKTKTGKNYLRTTLYGESGGTSLGFMWSFNPKKDTVIPEYTLVLAKFDKSDFGYSTWFGGVETIVAQEPKKKKIVENDDVNDDEIF